MDNILKRKDGETLEEYQIRLSLGLLNREIGYEELEWEDIKELLQSDKHRDTLRREGYGIRIYDEYMKVKLPEIIAKEEYEKILTEQLKIKKEKVKLRDERNLINTQIRNLARKENLSEILEDKLKELNMQPKIINDEYRSRISSGKSAIALFSDWHYGIEVDNFLNKFNPDICRERVEKLTDKIIDYCQLNKIDKLHVFIMGDII